MAATIKYQQEACSRCGGSGSYSYCQMYGSTCFKCKGKGKTLSKAGAKAAAAVTEFIASNFSVLVDDLKIGDRFKYDGRAVTIKAIQTEGGSRFGVGTDANGETIWKDYITVEFENPVRTAFGPVSAACLIPGTTVTKTVAGADWERVVEFARTIKKGAEVVEASETALA